MLALTKGIDKGHVHAPIEVNEKQNNEKRVAELHIHEIYLPLRPQLSFTVNGTPKIG